MATAVVPPAAAAPSAPSPVSGGYEANVDAVFDRAISSPGDSPAGGGSPDEPVELPEVIDDGAPAAEVTPDAEPEIIDDLPPQESAPADAAPEEVDHLAEIKPEKVSPDGKLYHTTKAKWERLTAADKTVQALRELDPGITVDAIKEMHGRVLALDTMLADFDSAEPARVAQVASAFTGADEQGRPTQSPQAVTAFIDSAMGNVAKHYPAAYKTVENKILHTLAQRQYAKYQQTRDEADKTLAWNLDYMARGDYRRDIDQQAAAPQDPIARERAALARERQSYELRINQDRQTQVANAISAAETEAKSVIDQSIESGLSGISTNVREKKPTEFKHAQRDLREKFEEYTKGHPSYQQSRNVLLSQLRANPTPETRSALVAFEKKWADFVIGRAKIEVTSAFSNGIDQQTKAINAKHEKLQERREPSGNGGTPVQRATLKQVLSNPATDFNKAADLLFDTVRRR